MFVNTGLIDGPGHGIATFTIVISSFLEGRRPKELQALVLAEF